MLLKFSVSSAVKIVELGTYIGSNPAGRAIASSSIMVTVAQLVEPRIVIPVVAGSSPVSHPINFPPSKCLTQSKALIALGGYCVVFSWAQYSSCV